MDGDVELKLMLALELKLGKEDNNDSQSEHDGLASVSRGDPWLTALRSAQRLSMR